ncbi:hypothetical protein ACJX4N_002511 [Enterococcus faecalis]|uniref:hypothetical protein n=1 Tax=Enterococcus faecalis TaxID=1351 RepID=UPI0012E2FA5B|nr:hypothetical protein [Enterococcus faecalis]EGO5016471.1 hypothetical protein [Enterococcus faecalis]EGO6561342.1 hypothetical protein [Enterococcus faecalis]EGO7560943.1 hypothetical protein [Enterococcus faecalis]EGO7742715.1 hypothetical protein [Enterococcus faecalis]EGO8387400.1 hypothetical protein [Enterococcus faecalis]
MKSLAGKSFILSLLFLGFGTATMPLISHADVIPLASGNWNSVTATDLNGLSQTGTVNRSSSTSFTLAIKYSNGSNVGSKTVTIASGASNYHDAWGTPFQEKYGSVNTSSTNHDPWFNA